MGTLEQLGVILGGTTVGVAAIAYLAKSLMNHLLSKDLEQHKVQLDEQTKLKLDRLRADITQQNLEHDVKYRRIDEKVSEHLAEIFAKLTVFYECVTSYVSITESGSEPSKKEKLESTVKANDEFWDYLVPNRIYIPPRLYKRIRSVAVKLSEITSKFAAGQRLEENGRLDPEENYWDLAIESIKEEATPLFNDLISDFQQRLGIHDYEEDDENT